MPDFVKFHAISQQEKEVSLHPEHKDFGCGTCGQTTNGRVIASFKREVDGGTLHYCYCSCPKREPTILLERGGNVVQQIPESKEFISGENWPNDSSKLFDEASACYSAGAYNASAMVCRKILMVVAAHEGAEEGLSFAAYVDHIVNKILTFPKAKEAIDKIRNIGNDANHRVVMVQRDQSRRALQIIQYMLNTIYSLPHS